MKNIEVIAEGEINHNGDVELAKKLVESAHQCGADIIKFQCMVPSVFVAPGSKFAPIFKDVAFGLDKFREIYAHAKKVGITMISTAVDVEGLKIITELDMPAIKIGSTNITNIPLLERISETKKPVLLSSGASTLGEIETALDILYRGTDDISLFHCTVQYPAPDDTLNLKAMQTMMAAFPGVPVGYSDHSDGNVAAVASVALGATLLEKHFTLDHDLPGPDHGFSFDPDQMKSYVDDVRAAEKMLGSPRKAPIPVEREMVLASRRFLTANGDIKSGDVFSADTILPRRVDTTGRNLNELMTPHEASRIDGWVSVRDINNGDTICWQDVRPAN